MQSQRLLHRRRVSSRLACVMSLSALCIGAMGQAQQQQQQQRQQQQQQQQDAPLLKILDQFTAPDVPAQGPAEPGPTTRNWWDPTTVPSASTLPAPVGNGLAQHPMLYAGE